jgi:hypothetical protein
MLHFLQTALKVSVSKTTEMFDEWLLEHIPFMKINQLIKVN